MTQTTYSLFTHVFQIKTGEKGKCNTRSLIKTQLKNTKFILGSATIEVTFIIKAVVLIPYVLKNIITHTLQRIICHKAVKSSHIAHNLQWLEEEAAIMPSGKLLGFFPSNEESGKAKKLFR